MRDPELDTKYLNITAPLSYGTRFSFKNKGGAGRRRRPIPGPFPRSVTAGGNEQGDNGKDVWTFQTFE